MGLGGRVYRFEGVEEVVAGRDEEGVVDLVLVAVDMIGRLKVQRWAEEEDHSWAEEQVDPERGAKRWTESWRAMCSETQLAGADNSASAIAYLLPSVLLFSAIPIPS
jgi:hypothetical protein